MCGRSIPDTRGSFPILSSGVESFYRHYKNKTKPKASLRAEKVAQYESPCFASLRHFYPQSYRKRKLLGFSWVTRCSPCSRVKNSVNLILGGTVCCFKDFFSSSQLRSSLLSATAICPETPAGVFPALDFTLNNQILALSVSA